MTRAARSSANCKPAGGPTLLPHHLAHLRDSGISGEHAAALGWYTLTDAEAARKALGWTVAPKPGELLPALAIPFPNADGTPPYYVRLRPDNPRMGDDGKPIKYESPVGQPNRVFFPSMARAALNDPAVDLVITEGEKKAVAAELSGFPCIGLVGVWGWKKAGEDSLNDDMRRVDWPGRRVRIVFDSDLAVKSAVQHAQFALAKTLERHRAIVRVVYLPQPTQEKVGLDDFLVRCGPSRFRDLLYSAISTPVPENEGTVANYLTVPKGNEDEKGKDDEDDEDDKPSILPKAPDLIVRQILHYCNGWPKAVGNQLLVPSRDGSPHFLKKAGELTAFVRNRLAGQYGGATARVRLKSDKGQGAGYVDEAGIFAVAPGLVERFTDAAQFPHEPPVPGVCYLPFPSTGGSGADLDKLIAMFTPQTDTDRELIRAFWLTLLWGGPGGRRPMFLFTGPENDQSRGVGVGKSSIPELAALFLGGSIDFGQAGGSIEEIKRRMLSGDSAGLRLFRLDNLKTHRFSWGELEGLVTADNIAGHRMFFGAGSRPNLFTYCVTLNGASLSTDIASRVAPVRLARPQYDPTWRPRIEALIRERRHAIAGDILAALRRPAPSLDRSQYSRWGEWEAGVLSRVGSPELCRETIVARQGQFDADREGVYLIRTAFELVLGRLELEPAEVAVRFTPMAACEVYRQATNVSAPVTTVSNEMRLSGIPELRKADLKGKRYWGWVGVEVKGSVTYSFLIDYDRIGKPGGPGQPADPPGFRVFPTSRAAVGSDGSIPD